LVSAAFLLYDSAGGEDQDTVSFIALAPLGDNDNKVNPNKAEITRPKVIDFSQVKPTTVTVTVKYSDGQPVPDYPFTLSAYVRDNSGGHDHSANRPTGRSMGNRSTRRISRIV
jgi:hypothetical protein